MALITIFRNAGKIMIRVPMLWFFSVLVFLSYNMVNLGQGYYAWLGCIGVLLFPLTALGQAGQIRSIQLYHDKVAVSFAQILRHSIRVVGPLIVILIMEILLSLIFTIPLIIITRFLFNQYIKSNIFAMLLSITMPIASIICTYARCALVMSNLPSKHILQIVLRTLQNGSFTNVILVFVFGLVYYILPKLFPIYPGTPVSLALYITISFVLVCVQAAVYTIAYIQFEVAPLVVQPK